MSKILSIEIGSSLVKICHMYDCSKLPRIEQAFCVAIEPDWIVDGCIIEDTIDKLAETIKKALVARKIRTRKAVFSLYSSNIISREITLPATNRKTMKKMIEINIQEFFPIDISDYNISFAIMNTIKKGRDTGKLKVLITAAEKKITDKYIQLANMLNFKIKDIKYSILSLYALGYYCNPAVRSMCVNVMSHSTNVVIVSGKELTMQRNLSYGYEHTTELKEALKRIVEFYAEQEEYRKPEEIFFCGDLNFSDSFMEKAEEVLGIPCRKSNYIPNLILSPKMKDTNISPFLVCVGSAMLQSGYLAESEKVKEDNKNLRLIVLLSIFFVVMIIAMINVSVLSYQEALLENQKLLTKKENLSKAMMIHEKYVALTSLDEQVKVIDNKTLYANDQLLNLIEKLEKDLPSDVTVVEFSSDTDSFSMKMRVSTKEQAAGVIEKIRKYDIFENVYVDSLVENSDYEDMTSDYVEFTIRADYVVDNDETEN